MLHASISVPNLERSVLAELHEGALRDHSEIARALDDELGGIEQGLDDTEKDRLRRERLRDALTEPSVGKHLEWYVRWNAGDHVRTRYNLACYVARLSKAAFDPETAGDLRQRGIDHVTFALRDRRLAAWAEQDPALTPLKRHDQWSRLVTGPAPAVPAAATGSVEHVEAPAAPEPAAPAPTDRRGLIGQLRVLLEEVRVPSSPSIRSQTEHLALHAESLSDEACQREFTALVASVHDSLTTYARQRATTAALPLVLERCFDGDDTRYVVADCHRAPK
jgi:hypothetical protein